jgi:hypothetical protein
LKTGPNFFLQHLKNKIIFYFVKFVATKKGLTTIIFHPFLLLLFLDPGSGMGKKSGSGIRNKHPGSATVVTHTLQMVDSLLPAAWTLLLPARIEPTGLRSCLCQHEK